jgi:hypothetical protein
VGGKRDVECKEEELTGPREEDIVLMENGPRSNLLQEEHREKKMSITKWIGVACDNVYTVKTNTGNVLHSVLLI